ncbi:hypothetical protein DLAC_11665 [Tieghemostelium lacteum]|uniref:Ribosomal protein L35 n=1 Tax=Tieghemostelium lacteum TaxID=361077 RepID=A0A151ZFH0_TIELA|nr:hypothetical protein DLAC_11665 [Tieghemostelium lacteum]|eukprot:KYQ92721.1 hypothetical protein DLAC_11665 [Tieghemostelium lacteum]
MNSIFNSTKSTLSLFINQNVTIQLAQRFKLKTNSACAKRFSVTGKGAIKFHPRASPGVVAHIQSKRYQKKFRTCLFSKHGDLKPTSTFEESN